METIIVGELPVDEVKTIIDCCREDLSDCENIQNALDLLIGHTRDDAQVESAHCSYRGREFEIKLR